jgi:hypothetical protein
MSKSAERGMRIKFCEKVGRRATEIHQLIQQRAEYEFLGRSVALKMGKISSKAISFQDFLQPV